MPVIPTALQSAINPYRRDGMAVPGLDGTVATTNPNIAVPGQPLRRPRPQAPTPVVPATAEGVEQVKQAYSPRHIPQAVEPGGTPLNNGPNYTPVPLEPNVDPATLQRRLEDAQQESYRNHRFGIKRVEDILHDGTPDSPRGALFKSIAEQGTVPPTYSHGTMWPERLYLQRHGDRDLRNPEGIIHRGNTSGWATMGSGDDKTGWGIGNVPPELHFPANWSQQQKLDYYRSSAPAADGRGQQPYDFDDVINYWTTKNHEAEHAFQQHDLDRRRIIDKNPKFVGPKQLYEDNQLEIGPSIGDLIFRAEQFAKDEGKDLEHTVKLPGGIELDINWMRDQARKRGYWGGPEGEPARSMQDLIFNTPEGRAWYKQMVERQRGFEEWKDSRAWFRDEVIMNNRDADGKWIPPDYDAYIESKKRMAPLKKAGAAQSLVQRLKQANILQTFVKSFDKQSTNPSQLIKRAQDPRIPMVGSEFIARQPEPTPDWAKGPFKFDPDRSPNPYLSGMLRQESLGPALHLVSKKLHSFDSARGQLGEAIARQQVEGGPEPGVVEPEDLSGLDTPIPLEPNIDSGLGVVPTWQAQSPVPRRMLQERGMLQGANVRNSYDDSPGGWAARFMGPHAEPGTGNVWTPEELPFRGWSPLMIGGSATARDLMNVMGREAIVNHELEHATRQHNTEEWEDEAIQDAWERSLPPTLEDRWSDYANKPVTSHEPVMPFDINLRRAQESAFAEIGPTLSDVIFRGEQFNRENPGKILYNKPIPPSEKNWVTGKPSLPEVEDPRPWYEQLVGAGEPPEQPYVPQGPPVPEHNFATNALRSMLDDPSQSPETKDNLRRALEFAAAGRDSAVNRENELVIELPGGVKMKLSNMLNMAAEHGYWGGGDPRYKMNEPWKKDDAARPLSMHELLLKGIENDPIRQRWLENMVRGEARKRELERRRSSNYVIDGKSVHWDDMTPKQRARFEFIGPQERFEKFDMDKQRWNNAHRAQQDAAMEAMMKSSNILQTFVKSSENSVKVAYGDLNAPGTATIKHLGSINKN